MKMKKQKKLWPCLWRYKKKITKRKRNKKFLEPAALPHLPEEIIFEIISRLPKGIRLKFRCVCKSWSMQFNIPKQLLLLGGNEVYTLDNDSLTSPLLERTKVGSKKIESSFDTRCSFAGTCNGLICVDTPRDLFYLWNPFTNEYKLIPRPPSASPMHGRPMRMRMFSARVYGFGYDSKSDDYKLACITSYSDSRTKSEVVIYSLRSNVWKPIQDIPYRFTSMLKEYGVFCNGSLHWFAESGLKVLIALDMTDEITKEIPEPNYYSDVTNYEYRRVGVLDGCLCMLFNSTGFEVWLMKDYGNTESWTKIYFIPKLKLRKRQPFQYLRKMECLKTGELLLQVQFDHTEALVLYNPKNDRARVLKPQKNRGCLSSKSLFQTYEKSLVPLHSGTYFGDNVP